MIVNGKVLMGDSDEISGNGDSLAASLNEEGISLTAGEYTLYTYTIHEDIPSDVEDDDEKEEFRDENPDMECYVFYKMDEISEDEMKHILQFGDEDCPDPFSIECLAPRNGIRESGSDTIIVQDSFTEERVTYTPTTEYISWYKLFKNNTPIGLYTIGAIYE